MSLLNVSLFGNKFEQDPKPEWLKINNVGIGESRQYGFSEENSNGDIGGLLDRLKNHNKIVVVIYDWNTNKAFTKSGFNLSSSSDIKQLPGYTTFVLKRRINEFYNSTPKPSPKPSPIPFKQNKRVSVYVMPGSNLIQQALWNVTSFKPSFTIAFWNSNGWDCGYPDKNILNEVIKNGGNLTVSFGGAAGCASPNGINNSGGEPALLGGSIYDIKERYAKPIREYNFNYADFDIEGIYDSDYNTYSKRNDAIVLLQKEFPNLKISFTVAGHLDSSVNMLNDALNKGVKIDTLNLMTMNYGYYTNLVNPCLENLEKAHKKFPNLNIGFIPLLGLDDQKINTYTLQNHKDIISQIKSRNMTYVTLFSYWCVNIDNNFEYLKEYINI